MHRKVVYMKTTKMEQRVVEYINEAKENAFFEDTSKYVTVRHLLWAMLSKTDSILSRYIVTMGIMDCTETGDPEIEYDLLLGELEEVMYWSNGINRHERKANNLKSTNQLRYDRQLVDVIRFAEGLVRQNGKDEIDELAMIVALVRYHNPIWDYMEEDGECSMQKLSDSFSKKRYLSGALKEECKELTEDVVEEVEGEDTSPTNTSVSTSGNKRQGEKIENGMFSCLNDKFKKDEPIIIRKRDDEIERVLLTLSKMRTKNAILIGRPGVGKSAIAEGIAEGIVKGTVPERFKDKKVLSLDLNSLMEDTKYVGEFEGKVKELMTYLRKHDDVILFIDEIHNIIGAGRTENSSYDLSNALKPILTTGEVSVIGATTREEYEKWIAPEGALKRRFEVIEVNEPKEKDLYEMLEGQIQMLSKYHNVTVSETIFETVISYASGMNYNTENPARTIELLDTAMAVAKQEGKKELDIISVLKVYKKNIKDFKKLREKENETLRTTAYHEVGHCITSTELCKKFQKVTYLSIIPAEDYLGVNVYEETDDFIGPRTREELINRIAVSLAGDLCQKITLGIVDAGKSSDLRHATSIANKMILEYGMQSGNTTLGAVSSFRRTESGEVDFFELSDEQKNDLVKERDAILNEAYEIAEKVLKDNKDVMEILTDALMERGALNKIEIEALASKKVKLEDLPPADIELIN